MRQSIPLILLPALIHLLSCHRASSEGEAVSERPDIILIITDDHRPGFDHWLSFKGQGTYWADGHGTSRVVPQTSMDGYNSNGERVPQKGYITDELTGYAMDWIERLEPGKPFFLCISHKAVHSDFVAAGRTAAGSRA